MENKMIAILPFVLDKKSNAIMHVLTCKDDIIDRSSVLFILHPEKADSEAVFKFLKDKFKISIKEDDKMDFLNNLFYLGELASTQENTSNIIPLYGINITSFIKNINAESLKDLYEVTPYPNLVKDANLDINLAASLFMLVSYLA